jgi:hypothetical protein
MEPIQDRLARIYKHIDRAVAAVEGDRGASPVLLAVVREFQKKSRKAHGIITQTSDQVAIREAVVELEQAGDSAKAGADADSSAAEETRKAVDLAHLSICLLKAGAPEA